IVGISIGGPDGVQHVFLYDGSSMIDLTPPGAVYAEILGFANNGVVVLKAHTAYNSDAGAIFVYDGTSLQAVSPGGTSTISKGPGTSIRPVVNASGVVAGASDIAGDVERHAFLYDGTGLHDLNAAVGGFGHANGINAAGQVVGAENGNAFLYTGGALANLND